MHKRQAIRDAIVAAVTGLSLTEGNVFASRVYPLDKRSLPGICVFTRREDSSPITISQPRTFERELQVNVEVYTRGVDGYDDQIDTICAEIENSIYAAGDLGGIAKDVYVSGTDVNYQDGAEQPLASAEIEVTVMYTTQEGSVTV